MRFLLPVFWFSLQRLWAPYFCAWCQSSQQVLLSGSIHFQRRLSVQRISAPGPDVSNNCHHQFVLIAAFCQQYHYDTVSIVDPNVSHTAGVFQGSVYWTVNLANPYPYYSTGAGVDGRLIAYPTIISAWTTNQGRDGPLDCLSPRLEHQ